ncbi:hypothetical protein Rleg4DRAFT_4903 [Rhizobium leguminosarum bv. trifolii WSM2297]|uniref:Uncharacterized protein n=1 Tax=Rhizobium leguminosarum bv. trifolii WSM2297 TaxID=754762 RepID=J0WD46_RHILT|nr:hypothetical protein Rleg4DRAFT_4903 [Rhizobium leguminosarum bv. trifolii WSM2297]
MPPRIGKVSEGIAEHIFCKPTTAHNALAETGTTARFYPNLDPLAVR